jgi:quinol monooxygenase YgiN
MYIVSVTFDIKAAHSAEFLSAVLDQAHNSLELEPDCLTFDVCLSEDQPPRVFLYEKYTDAAAFDVHLKSKHFAAFDAQVAPWVTAKQVDTWNQVGTSA